MGVCCAVGRELRGPGLGLGQERLDCHHPEEAEGIHVQMMAAGGGTGNSVSHPFSTAIRFISGLLDALILNSGMVVGGGGDLNTRFWN